LTSVVILYAGGPQIPKSAREALTRLEKSSILEITSQINRNRVAMLVLILAAHPANPQHST
jgi:hypothetical protein